MYTEILILANLVHGPQYGYEIKKHIQHVLGPAFAPGNRQLYSALHRFEELGALTREVERQLGKPDRHIYRLTDAGREALHELLCTFPPEVAANDAEFLVRVGFFFLLEPEARLAILAMRERVLREEAAHLQTLADIPEAAEPPYAPYAQQITAFRRAQTQHELDWIAQLTRDAQAAARARVILTPRPPELPEAPKAEAKER